MIGEIPKLLQLFQNRKLSADESEALQNRKLRTMIRYAYDNVPYYHSLFESAGLAPEDIRTVEDLKYIPITTKDDLRAAGVERIIAQGTKLSSCSSLTTSGTTGKPFTIYFTRSDWNKRRVIEFRTLLSIGFRPRDRLAVLGPARPHRIRPHQRLGFYWSTNISPSSSIEDQIQHLQKLQPTIFWAYPSVLRALHYQVDYRLSKKISPRVLITSAEVFDGEPRERIRADLGAEMFNFYGSNEFGRIAGECPEHQGLHVNTDHVVLECEQSSQPVERGKPGVATLTTLNVFAMPFIRYRLGDICTFLEKKCACGCTFPLIGPPQGRKHDMIRLPSGKILSPYSFFHRLEIFYNVDQFQMTQERTDHFVLQITLKGNCQDEITSKIRSRAMAYLDEPVRLDIQRVDFIDTAKPNFKTFISKLSKT
jgi:phenylacetate-CoA ligase